MAFEYYQAEDEIVDYLKAKTEISSLNIDVVPLPDDEQSNVKAVDKTRVIVQYTGSVIDKTKDVKINAVPEELSMVLTIEARSLRNNIGCHAVCRILKELLIGKKMTHGRTELYFKSYQPAEVYRDPDDQLWRWNLELGFKKMQVQKILEDDVPDANLQELTLSGGIGGNTVITSNG